MSGFVDLHCHWVAGIDDGARTPEQGLAMLRGLRRAGFTTVLATPHMRPGMFDNDRPALESAFARMAPALGDARARGEPLPAVHLASEHFFDDVVLPRLLGGAGLPFPWLGPEEPSVRRGVLVEVTPQQLPANLASRFFDLGKKGLRPVLAHPERYAPVWRDDRCLDPLIDAGAALLLDVCAVTGKYGLAAQRAAEKLLSDGAYEAACSDAHRPEDIPEVEAAIEALRRAVGDAELARLLGTAPAGLLGLPEGAS